ncbi:hypothetical protein PENSPDRAFT_652376 [Peniophora sp. CONT]|nr:hypothetical protein PENSPDRAFT_652376 [Peniophora sp. CONT]
MDRDYDRHRGREAGSSRRSRSRSPRRERRRDSPERPRRSRSPPTKRDKSPAPKNDRGERSARDRSRSPRRSRKHSRSRSRDRGRRRRSRSSSSSSSSDSDAERRRKKKRRKDKDRERSRSGSRERRKEKKRLKREKRERKKLKKSAATGGEWGKYGIISESDIYNKDPEFRAWLVEERMLNPETLPKDKTRKEFLRFVEDFNTATLPHEKFYHIEAYERRMNAMRSGDTLPPTDGSYDFEADIKAHKSTHKRPESEKESYLSKEQLQELRRVQNERIEAGRMKRLGMDVKQNMGVRMETTLE